MQHGSGSWFLNDLLRTSTICDIEPNTEFTSKVVVDLSGQVESVTGKTACGGKGNYDYDAN